MSYAVIKTGGKQYSVIEGQTLLIERLPDDVGATVELKPLLLAGDGDPDLRGRRPCVRASSRPRSSSTCAGRSSASSSSSPSAATSAAPATARSSRASA